MEIPGKYIGGRVTLAMLCYAVTVNQLDSIWGKVNHFNHD